MKLNSLVQIFICIWNLSAFYDENFGNQIKRWAFPHPYKFLRELTGLLHHPALSLVNILKLLMQQANSAESFGLESVFKVHLFTHIKHTVAISTLCRSEALISCACYPLEIWNRIIQVGRHLRKTIQSIWWKHLFNSTFIKREFKATSFLSFFLPSSPPFSFCPSFCLINTALWLHKGTVCMNILRQQKGLFLDKYCNQLTFTAVIISSVSSWTFKSLI